MIVGGDPANQQADRRAARAQGAPPAAPGWSRSAPRPARAGAARRRRPAPLPGEPGARAARRRSTSPAPSALVVLWDEADLAAEPDAAAALAEGRRRARRAADRAGRRRQRRRPARARHPRHGLLEARRPGEIDTLLTVHADPLDGPGASDWGWALGRVRARVAIATHASALTDSATVVLPAATHYETEGVYVAMNGRAQRLRPGARAARGRRPRLGAADRAAAPPRRRRRPTAPPPRAFAARGRRAGRRSPGWTTRRSACWAPHVRPRPRPSRRTAPPARARPPAPACRWWPRARIFGNADAYRADGLAGVRTGAELVLNPEEAAPPRARRRRPRPRSARPTARRAAGAGRRRPPGGRRLRRRRRPRRRRRAASSPPTAAPCGSRSRDAPDGRDLPRHRSSRPWWSCSC